MTAKTQVLPKRLGCGLLGLAIGYTVAIVLWTVAFWLPGGDEWPLQGTAIIGSWFYLPMWILLLAALVQRRPRVLLLLLIPLLLFGHDYGRYFFPRWPSLHAATGNESITQTVRVMTWNSYFRNQNGAALLDAIEEIQPDMVAIQELGYGIQSTLATELVDRFPYQERYPADGPSGMAFLSRYPIVQSTRPNFQANGCNCQELTIDLDGQLVTVINIHPWPPHVHFHPGDFWGSLTDFTTANQDETFDAILARLAAITDPRLLVGDFNTSERQKNYHRINAVLTDAFAEAGWGMGYTFPTVKRVYGVPVFPMLRLDYIFHDSHWQTKQIWRGTIDGSDHRYLVADLVLNHGAGGR